MGLGFSILGLKGVRVRFKVLGVGVLAFWGLRFLTFYDLKGVQSMRFRVLYLRV